MHWPWPRAAKQGKGPRQHFRQLRWVLQRMAEGADTGDQRALIRQFMQVTMTQTQVLATVAGGDHQHRHRVGVGLAHGGDDVGHTGTGDDETHTRFATGAGITVGHEPGALFVAWADVLQAAAVQAAIQLDGVHAGNAEDGFNAIAFQQLNERLGTTDHAAPL
ncbi:hypothetical protein D3C87_1511420 [compost metagenome]